MTRPSPPHPIRPRAASVVTAIAALMMLCGLAAPSAWAHTELSSSDPTDGGTVAAPPASVRLVFADRVTAETPVLSITVDGGAPVEVPAVIDGTTVSADLAAVGLPVPAASPAQWEIGYRLVALDGDAFSGGISFTVEAAAPATSAPAPESVSSAVPEIPSDVPETPSAVTEVPGAAAPGSTPNAAVTTTTTSEASAAAPGTSADSATPGTTAADPAATPSSGGGTGWWWFAGVAVVVLIAGAASWYRRSRRPGATG